MNGELQNYFDSNLSRFGLAGKILRVALSGGCDSVALCELLRRTKRDFDLHAIHVIHGIREEGEDDASFIREYCDANRIPLEIRRVDTPGFADSESLGIEEAARKLRYEVFREFTAKGEIIATAHTADDCVETLLFNLVRGAGPRGLAGIPAERDSIIRPLLDFWRKDLEQWLNAENIQWRNDESNLDLRFTRNRVRWMLVPELKRVFGDGVPERLRRETDIFSACAKFLDEQGRRIADNAIITRIGDILLLDSAISTSTLWGFGEVLRRVLSEFDIGHSELGFDTVSRLLESVKTSRRGRRFPIVEGLHLENNGDIIFMFRNIKKTPPIEIPQNQWIELPGGMGKIHVSQDDDGTKLPYDGSPLLFRHVKPGDITASGKKLRRYLTKKGVPRLLRDYVPVLFSGETPLFSPITGRLADNPSLFTLYVRYEGSLNEILRRR